MPRFAVLTHDHPFLHWDFLLEQGSTCRTWRLLKVPNQHDQIPAESLPDHRPMYLDFEGPVSGDRGTVSQWDSGVFEWLVDEPDRVHVRLMGRVLNVNVWLTRLDNGTWVWKRIDE